MKIYVASKFENKDRVREVMNQLRMAGHEITHDWTREKPHPTPAQRTQYAEDDRQAVLRADAYVGIFEKDLKYSGALVELGIAVARGIPIYILGSAIDRNIFLMLPNVSRDIKPLLGRAKGFYANLGEFSAMEYPTHE